MNALRRILPPGICIYIRVQWNQASVAVTLLAVTLLAVILLIVILRDVTLLAVTLPAVTLLALTLLTLLALTVSAACFCNRCWALFSVMSLIAFAGSSSSGPLTDRRRRRYGMAVTSPG